MTFIDKIRFSDLNDRMTSAHEALDYEYRRLEDIELKNVRTLSVEEEKRKEQLKEIREIITKSQGNPSKVEENADPLFVAARTLLNEQAGIDPELRGLSSSHLLFGDVLSRTDLFNRISGGANAKPMVSGDVTLVALTIGLLAIDGVTAPPVIAVAVLAADAEWVRDRERKIDGSTAVARVVDARACRHFGEAGVVKLLVGHVRPRVALDAAGFAREQRQPTHLGCGQRAVVAVRPRVEATRSA